MKFEATFRPKLKKIGMKKTGQNQQQLHILSGILAAGIVFGVVIYLFRRTMIVGSLIESVQFLVRNSDQASFAKRFLGYICSDMVWLFAIFVLGSSIYGGRMIYILLFVKAAGISAQACLFIQNNLTQGISIYYLIVFPGKCLLLLAMLIMGQNCVFTSNEIKKCLSEQGVENKRILSLFVLRSAVACGIVLAADLLIVVLAAILPPLAIHTP